MNLETAFKTEYKRLVKYCAKRVKQDDAEDIVMTVFTNFAVKGINDFEPNYLMGAVKFAMYDKIRMIYKDMGQQTGERFYEVKEPVEMPKLTGYEELTDRSKEILNLTIRGLTSCQISRSIGCPTGTVKSSNSRTIHFLKQTQEYSHEFVSASTN